MKLTVMMPVRMVMIVMRRRMRVYKDVEAYSGTDVEEEDEADDD